MKTLTSIGVACLLAASVPAHPQEIVAPPAPPTDLTPASGDYQGRISHGTPLVLGWTQIIPTGGGMYINPPATHFLVCIDSYAAGTTPPACNLANRDYIEEIANHSAALTRSGNRFTFMPGRFVEDIEMNAPLRVTVVACSTLLNRSCRGSSVDNWYSTFNPKSDGAQVATASTPKLWKLDVRAMNDGDGEVAAFSGSIQLFEVLGFGNPGRDCLRDVDSLGNQPDLVVIDKQGGMTPLPMVHRTNGVYDGPAVAGIFRQGSFTDSRTFTTGIPSLHANETMSRGIFTAEFMIPQPPTTQRTFVAVASLDTGNVIREFNERDNVTATCRKR